MRFLQVHNFYDPYLESLYTRTPSLCVEPYSVQIKALVEDGFSGSHIMTPYLAELGWETMLSIANCLPAQTQWIREHGLKLSSNAWMLEIVQNQINQFRPDVVYFSHPVDFDSSFIRSLTHQPRFVAGWRAAEVPEHLDLSSYDLMFSSDPYTTETLLKHGAKQVIKALPGFPVFVADAVANVQKRYDVTFTGQYGRLHHKRNSLLESVVRERHSGKGDYSIAYHLLRGPEVQLPKMISDVCHPAVFGMDMYRSIKQGRIALNAVVDFAKGQAGNMRQFEVVGCGSLLMTEHHESLTEHFEIGTEIETYRSADELMEKVRYYLDHPSQREEIARRGHERCLREHSMQVRAQVMKAHIERGLGAGASPTIVDRQPAQPVPTDPLRHALFLVERERCHEAVEILCALKSNHEVIRDVNMTLGLALIRLGRHDDARLALSEELRLFPQNTTAATLMRQLMDA